MYVTLFNNSYVFTGHDRARVQSAFPQPEPIRISQSGPSTVSYFLFEPSAVVDLLSENMAIFQYTAKGVDLNNLIFFGVLVTQEWGCGILDDRDKAKMKARGGGGELCFKKIYIYCNHFTSFFSLRDFIWFEKCFFFLFMFLFFRQMIAKK